MCAGYRLTVPATASPLEANTIEMAEYFWYFNHAKARRELGFTPLDRGDTLNDIVSYVRENFLGGKKNISRSLPAAYTSS